MSVESQKRRRLLRAATRHVEEYTKNAMDYTERAVRAKLKGLPPLIVDLEVAAAKSLFIKHDPKDFVDRFKKHGRW